ncbi:MAG TPA: 3-oxoacyl-ACP reductase [Propionicimonas sp.]|uniref:3-oxoacyl-ACP reductase n=1 Tax=Propionicimonas sp. TaxID=1955623 RepID=UPI002F3EF6F6
MAGLLERAFTSAPGRAVAGRLGLAEPPRLRRGRQLPDGPVVLASLAGSDLAARSLAELGIAAGSPRLDGAADAPASAYAGQIGALVVDARGLITIGGLEQLRAVLRPAMKALEGSGRVVLIADSTSDGLEAGAVHQALDGINRTVGKELRGGATTNLVHVPSDLDPADLASTLSFLLEGRSAFVDGQAWTVASAGAIPEEDPGAERPDPSRWAAAPLAGRIVVVTGAARGIGAQIATVAARDGATVVCVDVPAAGEALAALANQLQGSALQLDITSPDAGERIAAHVASRHAGASIHGMVHNAGITRDKLLANTDAQRWAQVLDVNLTAQLRMNPALLDGRPGGIADAGRIVSIASTSGIAGNKGQANYAASKAGVIGLVRGLAPDLAARGITVNAVAPGFIETEMTAKIPFVQREVFRRANSLGQGGRPVDVAETIGYFLDPASGGVTGQVIRVCGQNLVGQ